MMKTLLTKFFGAFLLNVEDITKPIARIIASLEAHEQRAIDRVVKVDSKIAWLGSHRDHVASERERAARIKAKLQDLMQ